MSNPNPNQDFINNPNSPIVSQESSDLALLDLNSTPLLHPPCSSCGGASNKRRSPDSPIFPSENPKKISSQPHHNAIPDFSHISFPDFSKISLGSPQDNASPSPSSLPVLRRCLSDPYKSPSSTPGNLIPATQSPPQMMPPSKGTASLPPRPPIRRCLSDLPEYNKSLSRSSSSKDLSVDSNSESQWHKRMRSCVKEMNQCWDELMAEKKEQANESNSIVERETNLMTDSEDTVSVEKSGDCLIIHLKCSCSKGFDFMLSGHDCYYKLL